MAGYNSCMFAYGQVSHSLYLLLQLAAADLHFEYLCLKNLSGFW
jgi:hypothetical protein